MVNPSQAVQQIECSVHMDLSSLGAGEDIPLHVAATALMTHVRTRSGYIPLHVAATALMTHVRTRLSDIPLHAAATPLDIYPLKSYTIMVKL